jgi:serine/threonine-protein kinase
MEWKNGTRHGRQVLRMEDTMNRRSSSGGTTALSPRARLKEIGGFELLSRIGEGAMGTVFKARQKSMDRVVAVKILPPAIAANREFIARFMKEARSTGKLTHPNIVSAIDVGQDAASGLWYFAMEYVDGPSLRQVLDEQEVFEERRALEIVSGVARALECANRTGLVHRDVKPHNIMLTSKGVPKLADLGLAHEIDSEGLNETGRALGTPCYMSPEQVRGEIDQLDIRTDLYSLGATLFHLVTGRPPYTGKNSAEIMSKQLYEAIPQASRYNRKISIECSRIINSLMQKEKERRMRSPLVLIEAIDRILCKSQMPGHSTTKVSSTGGNRRVPVVGGTTTSRPVRVKVADERRRPQTRTNYAGLLLAVVVLAGGGFVWWSAQQTPDVSGATQTADPGGGVTQVQVPMPEPKTATAETATVKRPPVVDPLAAQWKKAQLYANKFPGDHAEIVRRYAFVLKSAQGAPLEKEIAAALKGAEAQMQEAIEAAWPPVEAEVAAAAGSGDFDLALKVLERLPDERRRLLREQIEKRTEALYREAEERINPVVAKVEETLQLGDPVVAHTELVKLDPVRFAPMKAALDLLKERVEKERTRVESEFLQKRFNELLTRFDAALMETEDGEAAAAVAGEARRAPEFERFGAKVSAMYDLAATWKQVYRHEGVALEKLRGAPLKIGQEQGVVEKVEDRVVYLRVSLEGGRIVVVRKIPAAQLPEEVRLQVLKNVALNTPAEKVAGALRRLVKGREHYESAKGLLDEASSFALAPHYLELILLRQSGSNGALAKPMR